MIIILFFAITAHADPVATVWARNPEAVRKFFPPDKYRLLDANTQAEDNRGSGYLMPSVRDGLFHKVAIEEQVKDLDELNKDMLVMGARFEKLETIHKNYPMLSPEKIKQLQHEVRELAKK